MRQTILVLALVTSLFLIPLGCQKSEMCTWAQSFFIGAQLGLGLFGTYSPIAQRVITNGQAITTMLCQETDVNKQAELAKHLMITIEQLNELGARAGIQ